MYLLDNSMSPLDPTVILDCERKLTQTKGEQDQSR